MPSSGDDIFEYEAEADETLEGRRSRSSACVSCEEALAGSEPFDVSTTEAALRVLSPKRRRNQRGQIHSPATAGADGEAASSPPIFDVAVVLGKERSLRRLRNLIARIPTLQPRSAIENLPNGRSDQPRFSQRTATAMLVSFPMPVSNDR